MRWTDLIRRNTLRLTRTCAVLALGLPVAAAHAQGPANDFCDTPEVINGVGTFAWSNVDADTVLTIKSDCFEGDLVQIEHDIWFCWTSACDGLVRVSTCNFAEIDTRLQMFSFCECPTEKNLLCCGDNECGEQAELYCDVVCDRPYMIRLGSAQPGMVGAGFLEIECVEASCASGGGDPEPPTDCDNCCEERPSYTDPEYAAFGGGQVAFQTRQSLFTTESVLLAYDLTDEANAPLGTNWTVPRYEPALWSRDQLGSVFGVAVNGLGEVFVSHTSCYGMASISGFDNIGALGAAGSIYYIDPVTAQPSNFVTLPNFQDPAILPASESWPGLGNIAWDCANDVLFASNFEDGRIYRIDSSGTVLDTYDHATGVVSAGGAVEPNDPPGFAPLGERVWAVCPGGSRLYYSIWVEDQGRPDLNRANEIWSVEIGPGGSFVAGTATLEIEMPGMGNNEYSSPVSDLAMTDECCLLSAERGMQDDTRTSPHSARVMKFCLEVDGGWTVTDGPFNVGPSGTNASGGVDFDNGPDSFVWAPGDYLQVNSNEQIYGLSGQPITGANPEDCILIDADTDIVDQEKTEMGSVEVTCWEDQTAGCVAVGELDCIVDENGVSSDYALELTVTNNSGQDAHFINIPGAVSDNVIPLPPLGDGQSIVLNLILYGPIVGDTVCLNLTLLNADFEACCAMEVCLEVPDCDCAILEVVDVQCIKDGLYTFTLSVTNLYDPHVFEHLFFNADSGSTNIFNPEWIDIPSLPPFTKTIVGPISLQTGSVAGDTISVSVALHNEQLKECCVEELTFVLPECDGPSECPVDLNGDGVVDGADLGLLLANFGGMGLGDVDCDGDIDGGDLGLLLAAWGPVGP